MARKSIKANVIKAETAATANHKIIFLIIVLPFLFSIYTAPQYLPFYYTAFFRKNQLFQPFFRYIFSAVLLLLNIRLV